MLKKLVYCANGLVLIAATGLAGPFDPSKVAAEAKWVLHLDVEAFRKTELGKHLIETMLRPRIEQNERIRKLNLSLNLTNISGLTAYGPGFEKNGDGVLVLSTTANAKKDLDTLVGLSATLSEQEPKDVVMVHEKPFPLYSFKDQVYLAPGTGNAVLIAKSRDLLVRGREVILGQEKSLAKAQSFRDYPAAGTPGFLIAMAEGFNQAGEIPPQANVLRETDGGRIMLGEKEDKLLLNLVFKAKNDEACTKIQQVLQGIVALVSLSQQDREISELAAGCKIASAGRNVSIDLQIPTGKAISKIDEKHGKGRDRRASRRSAGEGQQDEIEEKASKKPETEASKAE